MDWLRRLDAHPKTRDEFRVRTLQGGVSTILAGAVALWLVRAELRHAWHVTTTERLYVNSSHGASVRVAFDIEFPRVGCDLIGVDATDQSGQPMGFLEHDVRKYRIDAKTGRRLSAVLPPKQYANPASASPDAAAAADAEKNKPATPATATQETHILDARNATECGDCYGAQDDERPCCETCDDVRAAYRKKGWTFRAATVKQCRTEGTARLLSPQGDDQQDGEGCAVEGDVRLPAVSGNFHFAPGRHIADARHVAAADLVALTFARFNVSHVVKRLRFGPDDDSTAAKKERRSASARDNNNNLEDDDDDGPTDKGSKKRRASAQKRRRSPSSSTKRRRRRRRQRRASSSRAARARRHKKKLLKRHLARVRASQLENATRIVADGFGMHQYYLKVVPTTYIALDGHVTHAAQYSVTEHVRHVSPGSGRGLPGVFFFYEVSPVCAEVRERREGVAAFLTGLSAIVGGVYVTFGLLDRCLAYFVESALTAFVDTVSPAGAASRRRASRRAGSFLD